MTARRRRRAPRHRASTAARGYGWSHQKLRAHFEPMVRAGLAVCWRCREPIHPAAKWHLGHDDDDRRIYRGPEHVACNVGAAQDRRWRRAAGQPTTPRRARALSFFDTTTRAADDKH